MKHTIKCMFKTCLAKPFFTIFLVLFAVNAKAQWPTSTVVAINTDQILTSATAVNNISCDAQDCLAFGGHIEAIAWDDVAGGSSSVWFSVKYDGSNPGSAQVQLPSGTSNPDIVIGDFSGSGGSNDYTIGLVYEDGNNNVMFDVYEIRDMNAPSTPMWVNHVHTQQLNTRTAAHARIDALGRETVQVSNGPQAVPTFPIFAIAWQEFSASTFMYEVIIVSDTFINYPGGFAFNPQVISADGVQPDVSCTRDVNGGISGANVVFLSNPNGMGQSMFVQEFDLGFLTNINTVITLESNVTSILPPRIESMGFSEYFNPTNSNWEVIASVTYSGNTDELRLYPGVNSATSALVPANTQSYSAVAIGSGPQFAGSLPGWFNIHYAPVYLEAGATSFHMIEDASASGAISFTTSYEVNTSPVPTGGTPIAASGITNSGRELFAAWFDGSDIMYKMSVNHPAPGSLKPSSIVSVESAEANIFPNPASTAINLKNIEKTNYTVTDMMGRTLLTGSTGVNQVDISSLTPGVYFMNLEQKGKTQHIKFIKE